MATRQPYFAEQGWYPASAMACRQQVAEYEKACQREVTGAYAGIVPHAGWVYSGRLATETVAALREIEPDLVFLFGGHMRPEQNPLCMPKGAFGTPLGEIEVAEELASKAVVEFRCQQESADSFVPDNTIELQLPILKYFWPRAKLVAIAVPPTSLAEEIGQWAAEVSQQQNLTTVAIGSTDLTHYGANYGFMPKGSGDQAHLWSKQQNDKPYIDHLLRLDTAAATQHALENHSACCPGAAAAAVTFAKTRGASGGHLLEHTTSHEIAKRGEPTMWVGYAGISF